MRAPSLSRFVSCLVLCGAVTGCGRTELLHYSSDASTLVDVSEEDAGHVACRPGTIALTPAIPKVMFVLDRSGSMSSFFGSVRATRWSSLTNALANVLPPVDSTMEMGALVFPSGNSDSCVVAGSPNLAPSVGNVRALVSLMRGTFPSGHTPTADAVKNAGAFLLSSHAASSARALVLATDGSPNCNASLNPNTCACVEGNRCTQSIMCLDDTRTVSTIGSLLQQNLPTYVIGIQDTNSTAIAVLNQMAKAGGRPQAGAQSYYAVSSQAGLETALTTIRNQVGSCVYLTSSVPTDDGSIQLSLAGTVLPFDPTGVDGWSWSNRDNGELVLTGTACAAALANLNATIEAHVLCEAPDGGTDAGTGQPDGGRDGG